ncbi:Brix domain family protein [Saccharomyces cerevisiae]|nr:Brix domain family protein [Saccharomyces cerevisiae]
MAKRRQKKRTHAQITPEQERDIPKSMVIRVGQTSLANHSLNQLVKDFRQIMQPHTAVKLKERKSNKLKDFVVMCGPLGVTHLFMFTQSEKTGNVSLKTPVKMTDNEEREKGIEEEDVEMEEPKPSENSQPTPRKKAIKLTELGPRLTLKLVKIEDGICSGKVLHHEFVQKSSEEIKALERRHAAKMRLKEQRRKEQEENIAKKKAVKDAKKQRKLERRKARAEEQGEGQGKDGAMSDDGSSSSEDEHYSDVPEDLDSDLFSEVE